jgi:Uma2 family endonuclease
MTQKLSDKKRYTIEEYLQLEDRADFRSEYHDGEILSMAGGTLMHATICANVIGALWSRLRGKPCQPFDSNLKIYIADYRTFVYPDATVICGPIERNANDRADSSITNPRVIVEVLSESTRGYDRGDKLRRYLSLPSLQQYILIEQDEPLVEILSRRPDGWLHTFHAGPHERAMIGSIEVELPLIEVYDGVEFLK